MHFPSPIRCLYFYFSPTVPHFSQPYSTLFYLSIALKASFSIPRDKLDNRETVWNEVKRRNTIARKKDTEIGEEWPKNG